MSKLTSPFKLGRIELRNRVVMAPLTRSRATDNVPNDLMAEYYGQRAGAGLIVTEGTSPSPNGLGYARIPGLFNDAQEAGWSKVAKAVHAKGGRIFAQLMHTGRISHPLNLPPQAKVLAPSVVASSGKMFTDEKGLLPLPVPVEMSESDIGDAIEEFATAAERAANAGLDGIELHSANGYLLEQFLNPGTNRRSDGYGGSAEKRLRFVVEVATAVTARIGADRVGMRISPYGPFNDVTPSYDGIEDAYAQLARSMNQIKLAYIHVVDHSSMGSPPVPRSIKDRLRSTFAGALIFSGGYDKARAEEDLAGERADLIAFGRPFISNPNLVEKMRTDVPLAPADPTTFYTPGPKGYVDYP